MSNLTRNRKRRQGGQRSALGIYEINVDSKHNRSFKLLRFAGDLFPANLPLPSYYDDSGSAWHLHRREDMLKKYGKRVRALYGTREEKGIYTAVIFVLFVIHVTLGFWVWDKSLKLRIALAATVGSFCVFNLQELFHEAFHQKNTTVERLFVYLLSIAADTTFLSTGPNFSVYYRYEHARHHLFAGSFQDLDQGLFHHWQSSFGNFDNRLLQIAYGLGYLTVFSIFTIEVFALETIFGERHSLYWLMRNPKSGIFVTLLKFLFTVYCLYHGCITYFLLSGSFALGGFGHPYIGFWIVQHQCNSKTMFQPTISYGGSRIWHLLNFGALYHVEHHDFPLIPGNRIHKIHAIAPEFYEHLHTVPSIFESLWLWLNTRGEYFDYLCMWRYRAQNNRETLQDMVKSHNLG
jgi:sphingolipid delta-4 desaturase